MTTFAADDLEAADLLALARPDGDGCRVPAARQGHSLARGDPEMIATADHGLGCAAAADPATEQRRARRGRFTWPAPAGGRHRTTMIAAAPGRARQQLTPALLGIG
jgi:hypothetical protein